MYINTRSVSSWKGFFSVVLYEVGEYRRGSAKGGGVHEGRRVIKKKPAKRVGKGLNNDYCSVRS